ncbi:nucleotide-binding protein, partial [Candidatus Woesearchaeota archaeon]
LDTNFLLVPGQFGVDIFKELDRICYFNYKLFIIPETMKELLKIAETQKGAHKRAAELAVSLLKAKNVLTAKTEKNKKRGVFQSVDDLIIETATTQDFIVATQDKELKKKLLNKGVAIITLTQKKYLKLVR